MVPTKLFSYVRQMPVLHMSIRWFNVIPPHKKKEFSIFCEDWKKKYEDVLAQPSNLPKATWEDMRNYMKESDLCPAYVDSFALEIFRHHNFVDAGISYYKFLKSNNYDLPISTLYKYLELYDLKDKPLSEAEKDHIYSLCKNIMSKYVSYEVHTSNILVQSFCMIDKWEEAIEIIKTYEANDDILLRKGYSSLISYFFLHDKVELGYKYLTVSFQKGVGPSDCAYTAYLKYCLIEKDTFNENVEKLFNLWNRYGIKPSLQVVCEYISACNQLGWNVALTSVTSKSICKLCNQKLSEINLTEEEYDSLRATTEKNIIFDNLYYVTNPKEIERFTEFVQKKKPFDIIIDGLNFVHCAKFGYESLAKYLKMYKAEGKKVLVIGRQHMMKKLTRPEFKKLAYYFFVENLSKDDAFILYAAFASGKHCKVISQDLMRNHKFVIKDPELDTLFKKWQVTQQYAIKDNTDVELMKLNTKRPIDAVVQKQNDTWHIPYIVSEISPRRRHTSIDDWACFKMSS